MWNIIMILGALLPIDSQSKATSLPIDSPKPIYGKIHEGMTKDALLIAWDKPSRIEKSFNLDHDYLVYSYDGEMCAYSFQSCTIRVESGKVTQFFDVKPDYAEFD